MPSMNPLGHESSCVTPDTVPNGRGARCATTWTGMVKATRRNADRANKKRLMSFCPAIGELIWGRNEAQAQLDGQLTYIGGREADLMAFVYERPNCSKRKQ